MRVIVNIRKSPPQRYLVQLLTKSIIKEVRDLINNKKHSLAVMTVFSKGVLERIIADDDLHSVSADLILSEDNASWDIQAK